jgi:hypothetical protein
VVDAHTTSSTTTSSNSIDNPITLVADADPASPESARPIYSFDFLSPKHINLVNPSIKLTSAVLAHF